MLFDTLLEGCHFPIQRGGFSHGGNIEGKRSGIRRHRRPSTFHLARRSSWSSPELYPPTKLLHFISRRSPSQSSSLLPAPQSTCLAGGFEFLVSIGEDLAFLAE